MSNADSLRSSTAVHGFWCQTGHPTIVDVAASVGPDFVCIDCQHGVDLSRLDASIFTTIAHYEVASLVRVPSIDPVAIGRALDLGANGIVVPLVETAVEARVAVDATRHAPRGGRSYGMQTSRAGPFHEEPFVAIQIETARSIEETEAIAAVEGVDALYIGPADLGLGLGGVPAPDVNEVFDGTHELAEQLRQAFGSVVEAAKRNGINPGLHCGDGASAVRAAGQGFTMMSVAADTALVGSGVSHELEMARGPTSETR